MEQPATTQLSFPSWRLMALDVGDTRIGVAFSDALGIVVTPHSVIKRRPEKAALARIVALATTEEAVGIIVGLPLSLSGEYSDQTRNVAAFAEAICPLVRVPVVLWDERYTTVEAERILREMGVRRDRWRERIDAVAATVILQDYLDAHLPPKPHLSANNAEI
jgi:putative holliday junction resolvase